MRVEEITRSHHVDQDEPDADGTVAWRFEYDLLTLRAASGLEVTARAYTDRPQVVGLLRFALEGRPVGQGDVKKSHMAEVRAFSSFLRDAGFVSVIWLGGAGYVDVPQ